MDSPRKSHEAAVSKGTRETASDGSKAADTPEHRPQPPEMTVSDPMRDGAVFNQPLDATSLQAKDSPVLEVSTGDGSMSTSIPGRDYLNQSSSSTSLALSRSSSESRISNMGSAAESSSQPPKRQPRKLTKNRGNSDTIVDKTVSDKAAPDKSTERHKGVLTKKAPQQKGSATPTGDGNGVESPSLAAKDELTRSTSAPQQAPSLKDRIFPS